jgi:sensor c-di-GMP phosphodiesterase-like protein
VAIFDDLEAALDLGDLFVEYLPTVLLADGCCVGGEALVRWRRGDVVVPAAAFIPLIENTPLSGRITYWVIDTVAAEMGDWLGAHADAHISINVPPEVLGRGGLAYAASRSGLADRSHQIVLELTERGVPDQLGLQALELMARNGTRLALDDTAMSGANLALLARCNFSMIKIDGPIVDQIEPGKPAPEWLGGLESLLKRSHSLQVVAEGVGSEYQATMLRNAGVQMAQGYFFSRPISASRFHEFYKSNRGHGRVH